MRKTKMAQKVEFEPSPAFDFSNSIRNVALTKMGLKPPTLTSTGTTIVAVVVKDAVVMGADSRSTAGNLIANKRAEKVHYITESIRACGAGTAADLDQVSKMLSANLRLQELNSGRKARIITAVKMAKQHLFQYQGYIGAYLLIGGYDFTGPHLYNVSANGFDLHLPFHADGSGSYCAMAILERDYKVDMTIEEGKDLVRRALEAGMHGDNFSGNAYNLIVLDKNGANFEGPLIPSFCTTPENIELSYKYKPGATKVLKQKTFKYDVVETMEIH
ncbi:Proteasome subunit beta [Aphelenchoides bicaudatus]|nr:Proteasome subunit beta [Aphelenchoides bicaudatus]